MFYRCLVLLTALQLVGATAFGERVFKTVNPNPDTETTTFKFDTNMYPVGAEDFNGTPTSPDDDDINIAPKIIFAPDGTKAFVAYAGADRVLVFSPSTGEVITSIDTSPNPGLMSITPDGKTLAVPCLYIKDNTEVVGDTIGKQVGGIDIIDVATHERKSVALTKVFFSFGNNVVFSADSKTGYVASAGTDEIIRFDVDSATEITPRLKMASASRPGPLTMAPDFSYFAVVTTGWKYPADPKLIPVDEVILVSTDTFAVLRHIATKYKGENDTTEQEQFFDFRPVNNVAFTSDGKWGVVADQLISHQPGVIGVLTHDRVVLFDPATGQIANIFTCGNYAGGALLAPDGEHVIIVTQVTVGIVEPENQKYAEVTPIMADFLPSSRPVYSLDGKRLYLAIPLGMGQDEILVFNMENGSTLRYFDVGKTIYTEEQITNDPLPAFSAAPLELAFSPDGKTLASLNFNANTIDLIKQTDYFSIPLFLGTTNWFTGVAILNSNPTQDATIKLTAYGIAGIPYTDDTSTTDVVEYTNPNTYVLKPGEQKAFATGDLLKPSSGKTVEGWLEADSDVYETTSFFLIGDAAVKRLDGAPLFMQLATTVVLPEVRVTDGFKTEISVLNDVWSTETLRVRVYNHDGELLFEGDPTGQGAIIGKGQYNGFVRDPDGVDTGVSGIVGEDKFTETVDDQTVTTFTNGYVVVETQYPSIAIEKYYDDERLAVLYGIPKGPGFNDATRMFIPQVTTFDGSETYVNLINMGTEAANVTLALKDSDGALIAPPVVVQLEPAKGSRRTIADLFGLTDNGVVLSGWIQVDSDKPGVIGDAEIRAYYGKAMTAIPLVSAGAKDLTFSHVAQGQSYSTGISLLNLQATPALALIEIFRPDGTKVADKNVTVPAGGRLINMLKDTALFPDLPETVGGYIRVTSDQDLVGLEIFFTDTLELLAVVPAQAVR